MYIFEFLYFKLINESIIRGILLHKVKSTINNAVMKMKNIKDYYNSYSGINTEAYAKPYKQKYWLHILLFCCTFITTAIAGVQWANQDFLNLENISYGLEYSLLLLIFLSSHEFGHYIASRLHGVNATLPYYIPFPPIPGFINFGTFGAVIKTKNVIPDKKALFDIGAAGPIAGFIMSMIFLIIGFWTLPAKEFIYSIHPEYLLYGGEIPKSGIYFGDTLLFSAMAKLFVHGNSWLPVMNEMYYYPLLNVGWFGLFVTTLNMLPFGQLDGGHIFYAMFGEKQGKIGRVFLWFIIIVGFGSLLDTAYELFQTDYPNAFYLSIQSFMLSKLSFLKSIAAPYFQSWGGWLFWAIIAKFFLKIKHPYVGGDDDIGTVRKIIGWFTILILVLSFSYNGIYIIE